MNRGSESILSVYSDARAEYTKQLCVFLVPAYFQFFIELLEKAKQVMVNEPKRALWQFQNYLNEIHDWNMQKVNQEIQTIYTNSGCDYLEDLLTAVFIAHTKVLTAIRLSSNKKKIEINVPKVEHFLFKVLCETSKLLWSSCYLFRDGISAIEKQQNYRSIEELINEGILQAIRTLVPVKSILKDFVNSDMGEGGVDEESDSEDEKEVNSEHPKNEVIPQPVVLPELSLIPPLPEPEPVQQSEPATSDIQEAVPVQTSEPVEPVKPVEPVEPIEPITMAEQLVQKENAPTIVIDDEPRVKFSEFDAVFDSDNPENSDLVYQPKDNMEDDIPELEILDDSGMPLSEGDDFDSLDKKLDEPEEISSLDYEELGV